MIKLIRVDERLIHGQVAIKWTKILGVDRILVLNDDAAKNDLLKKSLMMAAPQNVKVAIMGIEDGAALLNNPRAAELSILVIVRTPEDVLKIIDLVEGISEVNIGNFGRVAPKEGNESRKSYRTNLYLYDSEVQTIKKIIEKGIACNYQVIPDNKPEPLEKII